MMKKPGFWHHIGAALADSLTAITVILIALALLALIVLFLYWMGVFA